MKKNHIFTILISLILITSTMVTVYSQPINSSLIVYMESGDSTINLAIENIKQNYHNVIIVEYESLHYALVLSRVLGPVIWIGHGNEEGIQIDNHIISWKEASELVDITKGKDIFLSCNSYKILEYSNKADVITFGDFVDVNVASNIALFAITKNFNFIQKALKNYKTIESGKQRFLPLRIIGESPPPPPPPPPPSVGLDDWEKLKWTAMFIIDIIAGIILLHAFYTKYAVANAVAAGKDTSIIGRMVRKITSTNVYNAIKGKVTTLSTYIINFFQKFARDFNIFGINFILNLKSYMTLAFSVSWEVLLVLFDTMATATITEWIIFGIEFALSVFAIILTASTVLWVRLAGFLINLGLDVLGFLRDLND